MNRDAFATFTSFRISQACMNCKRFVDQLVFVIDPKIAACLCPDCAESAVLYFGWTQVSEEELEIFLVHDV